MSHELGGMNRREPIYSLDFYNDRLFDEHVNEVVMTDLHTVINHIYRDLALIAQAPFSNSTARHFS